MAIRTSSPARVHPIVRLDYLVRLVCFPVLVGVLYAGFHGSGRAGPGVIGLLAVYGLVWPHLAYLAARHSRDGKRAEHWNLWIDCFLIGAWVAGIRFSLWPSVMLSSGVLMGTLSVGGIRFAAKGILAIVVGAVTLGSLTGFEAEFSASPLVTGLSIVGIFVYGSIFSYHSHVQSKRIVLSRKQLEDKNRKLQEKSALVAAAKEEAEAANDAKSLFLANMSHELRTPLNAIIGYSEMLIEDAQDSDNRAAEADLENIRGAGKHLLGLINDVLDLSKVEAGHMELYRESFSIEEVVREILSTVRPLAERNGNTLELVTEGEVGEMYADLTKVRQVLLNLLSNANKFTEGGAVTLAIARLPGAAGETIRFQVTDTGIGMTPGQIEKLFQPFTQADASTTRRYGGTGLGLTISKRFCELMGGSIEVSSRSGAGTVFTVLLPAVQRQRGEGPIDGVDSERTPEEADGAGTILVVDDDPAARDLIARMLRREGYRVLLAADGEEALRLAHVAKPDAITLDILMPGMDGWAVLGAIKSDPEIATIPVAMASVLSEQALAYELGATDYLTKPVERARLLEVVRTLVDGPGGGSVLLVGGDPATRSTLRRVLEEEGCGVVEAADGEAALERLESPGWQPSLVIVDLMMSRGDGVRLVGELRRRGGAANVPLVAITPREMDEAERRELNGQVETVLGSAAYPAEEWVGRIRELARTAVRSEVAG